MQPSEFNDSGNQYTRKVTLPSGKTIEVISFEEPAVQDLCVCPECASELVFPVTWEEVSRTDWEVTLRCPNCEWGHTDIYHDNAIQEFDEKLDRGTEKLVADLRQLAEANMRADVDNLIAAINGDHLLPEDF